MLRTRSLQYLNPFCPQGGTWFVCPSGSRFLGCCTSDPCQNGCPENDLKVASFNSTDYGLFANQECVAGQFYTCEKTNPPFIGCCTINPCDTGQCPQTDLVPALLSNDPAKAADFLPISTTGTATTFSVAKSTISVASVATEATIATLTPSASPPTQTGLPSGAIFGIVFGGLVFFVCLVAIFMILLSRRLKARQLSLNENSPILTMENDEYTLCAPGSSTTNNKSYSPPSLGNCVPKSVMNFILIILDSPNGTWMTPVCHSLSHEPHDSPAFGSNEIIELDGTGVERSRWKTIERTTEDNRPSLSESNGI